jgi:hypothetical protein
MIERKIVGQDRNSIDANKASILRFWQDWGMVGRRQEAGHIVWQTSCLYISSRKRGIKRWQSHAEFLRVWEHAVGQIEGQTVSSDCASTRGHIQARNEGMEGAWLPSTHMKEGETLAMIACSSARWARGFFIRLGWIDYDTCILWYVSRKQGKKEG